MITTQYFNGRMTSAQMKKLRRDLSLTWHPDVCSDPNATKIMQQINAEFAYWYARAASEDVYQEKTAKAASEGKTWDYSKYRKAEYHESLESMINWFFNNGLDRIDTLNADIVGVFIWIGGIKAEDKELRELVKSVGFQGGYKYHDDGTREYMWKWTYEIKRFAANPNIDDIKRRYGSEDVRNRRQYKQMGG